MNRKQFVLSYILLLFILASIPALGNSTVLIANFLNGNNDFLQSRVYLWNPSASAGTITARAYRLPKSGPSLFMGAIGLAARGRSTFSELRWYPPMEAAKGSLSWVFRAKQPESVRTGP